MRQFVLQRLERAYVQMEGFNADVAHEMRTPLATLIGQTELALSGRRSEAVLRDVMGSNLEELQRLSGMVNDMLFLSQADRGAQARGVWVDRLSEVLGEVAEYHEAEAQERGLTLAVSGEAACIDRPLLQRAVSNLVSNAVRYADAGSTIRIHVSHDDEHALIAVSNAGEPIAKEHLPRLFHRSIAATRRAASTPTITDWDWPSSRPSPACTAAGPSRLPRAATSPSASACRRARLPKTNPGVGLLAAAS